MPGLFLGSRGCNPDIVTEAWILRALNRAKMTRPGSRLSEPLPDSDHRF